MMHRRMRRPPERSPGARLAPATLFFVLFILTALFAFIPAANADHLGLAWDAPTVNADGSTLTDLTGYRVYYGTSSRNAGQAPCNAAHTDVPNLSSYHVQDLTTGMTYYFQVTALDGSGNESVCSNELVATVGSSVADPAPTTPADPAATTPAVPTTPQAPAGTAAAPVAAASSGGGGGGGGCFIATAAFGSPQAAEVQALRDFRDRYLVTNAPGRLFVAAYYRTSPPIAEWLRGHGTVRTAVRETLRPVTWWAGVALASPALGLAIGSACLVAPLAAALSFAAARPGRRRTRREP